MSEPPSAASVNPAPLKTLTRDGEALPFATYWLWLLAVSAAITALLVYSLTSEYQRIEGDERLRMEAQVHVIETSVHRQFSAVSNLLQTINDKLPEWNIATRGDMEAWRDLTAMASALPSVRTLIVLNAKGDTIAINRREFLGKSFAQRDYFTSVMAHPDKATLYVSPPFKTALNVYAMSLSRMTPGSSGNFNGVVAATLDPDEFDTLLQANRYAPDVKLALVHESNKIFVAAPKPKDRELRPPGANELSVERVLNLPNLPTSNALRVRISRDHDQLFAPWREKTFTAAGLLLLLLVSSAASLRVYQRRHQYDSTILATNLAALRDSEERNRLTVEAITVGVMDIDMTNGIMRCDAHWYRMLGFAPDAFALTIDDWFWRMHPDDVAGVRASWEAMLASGESIRSEFRFRDVSDGWRWISSRGRIVARDVQQKPLRLIATHLDISHRKQAEESLQASDQRMRTLLGAMQDLVFFIDTGGHFVEYYAPTGRPDYFANGRAMTGSNYTTDLPFELRQQMDNALAGVISDDTPQQFNFSLDNAAVVNEGFAVRHFHCTLSGVKADAHAAFPIGFLGVIRDVTELYEADQKVRMLAFHDPLTHLPNRRLLMDRLIQTLVSCQRIPNYGALMFLDLDRFKSLNDTHGHDAGDQLLVEVANRLQSRIRATDSAVRLGGDEFVVMLTAINVDPAIARTNAQSVAEQIRHSLQQPYALLGEEGEALQWECSSSIGVRIFGSADCNSEQDINLVAEKILKDADGAMYAAKTAGRNQVRLSTMNT